jgi:glycosyltransferase involved in cell wall biosynthesis
MACGTPCVAFDTGGVGDLLSHAVNGYFASAGNVRELAEGIVWVLADGARRSRLGCQARKTIEDGFSLDTVVERYLALYERVLAK